MKSFQLQKITNYSSRKVMGMSGQLFVSPLSSNYQHLLHNHFCGRSTYTKISYIISWDTILNYGLMAPPLHKEEGSGTAPLLELFCWNAINICALALCYACFTLCSDMLTAAHGLHAACLLVSA